MDRPPEEHLSDEENGGEEEGDEEEEGPACDWTRLPDVCLRQVFWWLRDRERVRAASVCRHWRRVMHSPSLWRSRVFCFSGRLARLARRSEQELAVSYAQNYGRHLQDLELRLSHPLNSLVSRRVQRSTRAFLAALRKTGGRLRSLTLDHMELERPAWLRSVRGAVVRSLSLYLRREGGRLARLSLRAARLGLPHGLEVLEAVADAQQRQHRGGWAGLGTLDLEDFFSQPLAVYGSPGFPKVISRFSGLSSLVLSYSCVSDELLAALAAACRLLRHLGVRCHAHQPYAAQAVSGESWARLARRRPELRVRVSVERILGLERLGGILLREVPVRALALRTLGRLGERDGGGASARTAIATLLPGYRHCLQKLTLDLPSSQESVDEALLALVLLCPLLVHLKAYAFLQLRFVDRLLRARLDRKCCLSTIKLRLYTSSYDPREDEEQLEEVSSRYRQLILQELHYSACCYPML